MNILAAQVEHHVPHRLEQVLQALLFADHADMLAVLSMASIS